MTNQIDDVVEDAKYSLATMLESILLLAICGGFPNNLHKNHLLFNHVQELGDWLVIKISKLAREERGGFVC